MARARRDRFQFAVTALLCVALLSSFVGSGFALSPHGGSVPFARPGGLSLPFAQPSATAPAPEAAASPAPQAAPRSASSAGRSVSLGDLEWTAVDPTAPSADPDPESADTPEATSATSPGDVIVRFKSTVADAETTLIAARNNCTIIGHIGSTYRFRVNGGFGLASTVLALRAEAGTVYAEPDWAMMGDQARGELNDQLSAGGQAAEGGVSTGSDTPLSEQFEEATQQPVDPGAAASSASEGDSSAGAVDASVSGDEQGQQPPAEGTAVPTDAQPDEQADDQSAGQTTSSEGEPTDSAPASEETSDTADPSAAEPSAPASQPPAEVASIDVGSKRTTYTDEDGAEQPIDNNVVPSIGSGFDYQNAANDFRVLFRENAPGDALLELQRSGWRFAYSLEGADLSDAVVEGSVITFRNAFEGVDIRYTVSADAVKEDLILHEFVDRDTYSFALNTEGLSFARNDDGSLTFTELADGDWAFDVAAPVMYDSAAVSGGVPSVSMNVGMILRSVGDGYVLDLMPDLAWIGDPGRVFPVIIDPTFSMRKLGAVADSFVNMHPDQLNTNYEGHLYYGYPTVCVGPWDASYCTTYIKFDTSFLAGAQVLFAGLDLYCLDTLDTGLSPTVDYEVAPVGGAWDEYTLNYTNRPSWATWNRSSWGSVDAGEWTNTNVTTTLQYMADNKTNFGFMIYKHAPTYSDFGYFLSSESVAPPNLHVEYMRYPTVTPITLNNTTFTVSAPKLAWDYHDDAGNPLSFSQIQVWAEGDATFTDYDYCVVDTSVGASEFTLPNLEDGTYHWRVYVYNGLLKSQGWSEWRTFTVKAGYSYDVTELDVAKLTADDELTVPLEIRNTGERIWTSSGPNAVQVFAKVFDVNGLTQIGVTKSTGLPYDLPSGQSVRLEALIDGPGIAGGYKLHIYVGTSATDPFDPAAYANVCQRDVTVQDTYNATYSGRAPPMFDQENGSIEGQIIRIMNTSSATLSEASFTLGYRIVDRYGSDLRSNTAAGQLPTDGIAAGDFKDVSGTVTVDSTLPPGVYQLVWDLYSAGSGWLSGQGVRPLSVPLLLRVFGTSDDRPFSGPVDLTSGNLVLTTTDASIAGNGPSLAITRTYNSLDTRTGVFGLGISSNLDMRIQELDGGATAVMWGADGSSQVFTRVSIEDGVSTYCHPAGVYLTMLRNADGTYTVETPDFTVYEFTAATLVDDGVRFSRIESVTDRHGVFVEYVRNVLGQVTSLTRTIPGSALPTHSINIDYNASGYVSRVSYQVTNFNGTVESAGTTVTVETTYDYSGSRLSTVTADPTGLALATGMTYNAAGRLEKVTDAAGSETEYDYTGERVSSITAPPAWGATNPVTEIAYDLAAGVATVTDPAKYETSFTWGAWANPTQTTNAVGLTTYLYWNDFNDLIATVAGPNVTVREYDGDKLRASLPDAPVQYTYWGGPALGSMPAYGRLTSQFTIDQSTHMWMCERYTYDALGRLLTGKDKDGASVTIRYDSEEKSGDPVSTVNSLGDTTIAVYDEYGHVVKVVPAATDPDLVLYDPFDVLSMAWDIRSTSTTSSISLYEDASSPAPKPAPKMTTVWQFNNDGYHHYVDTEAEYITCLMKKWEYDGVVYSYDPLINQSNITRLISTDGLNHLHTISQDEVAHLLSLGGWGVEGPVMGHAVGAANSFTIYRFLGPKGDHMYGTSMTGEPGYTYEGPAWSVAFTPQQEVLQLGKTGSALRIAQTVDDGDTYISRTFASPLSNHVVEVSFFDGGTSAGTWVMQVDGSDGSRSVGLRTDLSGTAYCYEVNNAWSVGSVARSAGWHTVSFRVTSTGVRVYIDDNLLFENSGPGKTFSRFTAGCWTSVTQPLSLDDFKVYVAPTLRCGDLDGTGDWTQVTTGATGSFGVGTDGRTGGTCLWIHQTSTEGQMEYRQGYAANTIGTVWQLYKDGYHYYTASADEYAQRSAAGWRPEGALYSYYPDLNTTQVIKLVKSPAVPACPVFYTTNLSEVALKMSEGWTYGGVAFTAAGNGAAGALPVYRFHSATDDYFYSTTSTAPAGSGLNLEGEAWRYVLDRLSETVSVTPGSTQTLTGYIKLMETGGVISTTAHYEVRNGQTGEVIARTKNATYKTDLTRTDSFYHTTAATKAAQLWEPQQVTFTVPAGVSSVTVHAVVSGPGLACFDDVTLEASRATETDYDANHNYPVRVTGPDGQDTEYVYDSVGHVLQTWTWVNGEKTNHVTFTYDMLGRVVEKCDSLGGCVTTEHNDAARIVTTTTTLNATETAVSTVNYNPYGKPLQATDPDGAVTQYVYDLRGLLVSQTLTDANGVVSTVSYGYDGAGRCVSKTDGEGGVTTFEYDELGRLEKQTSPMGNATPNDANDYVTTYEYDAFGRVVKETDAAGSVYYTYSGGKLVGVTKALASAEPIFIDRFETFGQTVWPNPTGTISRDTVRHREGSASLKTGTGASAITHPFTAPQLDCTLELAFFDEQLDGSGVRIAITGGGVTSALEMSAAANGFYVWQSGTTPPNNTRVARAKGWHTLKLVVSAGGTDCYIDGILAGHSSTDRIEQISLGSTAPGNLSTGYFDDLKMYKTAQAVQFSRGMNVASRSESALAGVAGNGYTPKLIDGKTSYNKADTKAVQFTQVAYGPMGVTVVLENPSAISAIDVYFNDLDSELTAYSYRVEVSDDGQTWRVLQSGTASSWLQVVLPEPIPVRMIRVVNTAEGTTADIGEIQAWVSPQTASSSYDSEGQLEAQTDGLGFTTRFSYNNEGQLVWRSDARGNADVMVYDRSGRLVKTTDSLGNAITVAYDAAGRQVSVTDQLGKDATTEFDLMSRTIETVSALNHTASAVPDLAGRIMSITETTLSASGRGLGSATVSKDYSLGGRVTSVTDALGKVTLYEYDGAGRVTKVTDARGYDVSTSYFATGQVKTITNQENFVTTFGYDANGRLTETTVDSGENGLARKTWFSYDELDRLTSVTDGRGTDAGDPDYTTTYSYDARGNMIARTDTKGTTTFAYDAADRLISRTDPVGNVIYYVHDADGNITGVMSPGAANFVNVAFGAPAAGGLNPAYATDGITGDYSKYTTTNWTVSPQEKLEITLPSLYAIERIRVRLYDGDDRFFDYKVDVSADKFKWDRVVDKTAGEWRSWQDDAFAARPVKYIRITGTQSSLNWAFHTLEVEAYVDTSKISYVYDAENRLTHQSDELGRYITHAYDAKSRRISTTYPAGSPLPMDGTTVTYQYDAGDRLVSKSQTPSTGAAAGCDYPGLTAFVDEYQASNTGAYGLAWLDAGNVGEHTLRIEWTGVKNGASSDYWIGVDAFDVSNDAVGWIRYDDTNAAVSYEGSWDRCYSGALINGSFAVANSEAAATFRFTGRFVCYIGAFQTNMGYARLIIDDTRTATSAEPARIGLVDLVTLAPGYRYAYPAAQLSADAVGEHTLTVEWTGQKNAASSAAAIVVDAFDVSNDGVTWTRIENNDPRVSYSPGWGTSTVGGAPVSGGTVHAINSTGAATLRFYGRYVRLISMRSTDQGIARVTLDGISSPMNALYSYDSGGNLTQRIDAGGSYTYVYNDGDQLVSMLDSSGAEVAHYTYDDNGNCETKVLTVGGMVTTTTYTYDPCNRVLTQVATAGGATVQNLTYTYYSTGQVKTRTEVVAGVATTTTYAYDAAGQVISESVATGSIVTVRTYTYDGSGNRTSVTDSTITPTVQQDDTKLVYYGTWLTATSNSYSGGSHTYASTNGASVSMAFEGSRAQVIATKGYNYGKMLVFVDGTQVGEVDLYSPTAAYQQVVFDTGILSDGWHTVRLDRTGTKNAASKGTTVAIDAFVLMGAAVQFATRREQNDAGVTRVGTWSDSSYYKYSGGSLMWTNSAASATTTFTGEGFVLLALTSFAYGKARIYVDGVETDLVSLYSSSTLYRQAVLRKTLPYGTHTVKVEWTGLKDAAASGTQISIDALDVLLDSTSGTAQPSQTLAFDAANRVVGFTYDARGNVLNDGTYTYTWDAYNRLTAVKTAGTGALVASYAYDANGMRQVTTIGTTTRYVVDALTDEIVALTDTTGAVVAKFVRDAAGRLVSMVKGGAVYTYLTNAHGDVTALVSSAGAVVARWAYDAWGNPTEYNASGTQVAVGTAGNPFLYAGYYYDTETGHYYLRARYYDPRTGRFLSMDPEPGKTTDRLSQNPYIYCQNDPVNNTDRTGRKIDVLGHRPRNKQEAEAERRAQKAAAERRRQREAEARRKARERAEADRKARAAMDAARQAEGAATRERNKLYGLVASDGYAWQLVAGGYSVRSAYALQDEIKASPAFQQWCRGRTDESTRRQLKQAEDDAAAEVEWREVDGKYGRNNWTLERSQEEGELSLGTGVAAWMEQDGDILEMGIEANKMYDTRLLGKVSSTLEVVGALADVYNFLDACVKRSHGDATLGDVVWAFVGLMPGVSTGQLVYDLCAPVLSQAWDRERDWATPKSYYRGIEIVEG